MSVVFRIDRSLQGQQGPSLAKSAHGKVLSALLRLSRSKGLNIPPTRAEKAAAETAARIAAIEKAVDEIMQNALVELSALTPEDTGKTAKGYKLDTVRSGDSVTYTITHPNTELVAMLNYGTKPHIIRPKNAKVLKFIGSRDGKVVFTTHVRHPGTQALGHVDRVANQVTQALTRLQGVQHA